MSCYFLYVGDVVSTKSSAASLAMCGFIHVGHRVRDLSVIGVQGNVIGGRDKCVLDHSWILSLELHCFS